MIAHTPDLKTIVKNPTFFVHQIMSFADFRLNEIYDKTNFKRKTFILTGGVGKGKTTCIQQVIGKLRKNDISVSGIYSSRIMDKKNTIGYDVVDIQSGDSKVYLTNQKQGSQH